MMLLARAMGVVLVLAAVPQAPRTALGRCTMEQPAASYQLPAGLVEVSGLASGPGGTLITHSDERGIVTVLDGTTLKVIRQVQLQGTPRDDFEGIASAGDSVALMTSAGRIYLFRVGAAATVPFTVVATGLGTHCELEGLGWHRATGTLLLPCKQPRVKAKGLTVFRYRLGPAPGTLPPIVMSAGVLALATGLEEIRATSIDIDPVTGNLVVLSSKPPLVLEMDMNGRSLGVKRLPSKYHPQAEGLTMSANALWIADEGTGRKGTLVRYSCR